jgi:CheY-like chemotaxis protein
MRNKILIVDDEEELLSALEIRLHLMNYDVVKAQSAMEAFERIKSDKPNVLILDIHLPGLNGIEICDVLKKDPETARIPVIFLTGSGDDETRLRAEHAGAFSFLTKPLDPVVFQDKIRKALGGVDPPK